MVRSEAPPAVETGPARYPCRRSNTAAVPGCRTPALPPTDHRRHRGALPSRWSDRKPRRQLKLARPGTLVAEVIQQPSLVVEHLHYPPQTIDDIEVPFRVDGQIGSPAGS